MKNAPLSWLAMTLLTGLLAGGAIGFSLGRHDHIAAAAADSLAKSGAGVAETKSRSISKSLAEADATRISLGNIATVPFSELYSVLSALPEDKLNELAAELNNLPADKQTGTKIATFFKAWAHFDPKAALQAAITFKSAEAKTTAVSAVIESADMTQAEALARTIKD